ncbi:TDP-N-acetylfucosamine:lipid II N-acetylfucosaminyltransferase [Cecembia lonarensis]|uniref:4-alpha-L-fucosyltransferase n=1 Tax=Cecembia lonarensis (strain CCUG 58316 / KCTC 22772 / LW9) TaxID=1225176 RepID=K1L1T3_CECL9|nr:TDP-N-acetylfucosamine:lipid II N-acetylfucosaminyltransferase [Cecembia lonarensis]EKB48716.1 4-alpha-L-fucosyltransferase [Cecembia lonarensis LW9]
MAESLDIIHLCEDEKFINLAIEQFEFCFPGQNIFYVIPNSLDEKLKHVSQSDFVIITNQEHLILIISSLPKGAIIILHSLSPRFYNFVIHLPESLTVVWLCFGFEIYKDPIYFNDRVLLDKLTLRKFPLRKVSVKESIKEKVRPFYRLFNQKLPLSKKEYKQKALKRINYLGSSFKEEFDQISKMINQRKNYFSFWYFPIEIIVEIDKPFIFPKTNMLIGNSGFNTMNHLDVFHKIKRYHLDNMNIIVPLNYGKPEYIEYLLIEGERIFQNKFNPLLSFMDLHVYNSVLNSVGVAIFNNKRQQAIGNTIALLWFGSKIFLSEKNSFYHYLKRIGIIVFCYESELNEKSFSKFLSLEEIEHNRRILLKELNKEHLGKLLKEQILKINK